MQPIIFCNRCRGMKVGWNRAYVRHSVNCKEWISRSSKLLILSTFLSILVFAFPIPSAFVFSGANTVELIEEPFLKASLPPSAVPQVQDAAVGSIKAFLGGYAVDSDHRLRVAEAIVHSSRKHDVDARLVASIMIVESGANPFAISQKDSVGIMQIHLPTWGQTAEKEGINLFKVEDNVDFGVRILRDYIRQYGIPEGVKRYKGWNVEDPDSAQSAEDYLQKVQRIYAPETT